MADKKATEVKDEAKTDLPELKGDAVKVLEMVEKMTVLELADLVKVMEDKFGVSAAAPVAVAVAGAAAPAEEEKSAFDVVITATGDNKIGVIKAVREMTELGLMEAKTLVEATPATIKEKVATEQAEEYKTVLEAAGATVELQ